MAAPAIDLIIHRVIKNLIAKNCCKLGPSRNHHGIPSHLGDSTSFVRVEEDGSIKLVHQIDVIILRNLHDLEQVELFTHGKGFIKVTLVLGVTHMC